MKKIMVKVGGFLGILLLALLLSNISKAWADEQWFFVSTIPGRNLVIPFQNEKACKVFKRLWVGWHLNYGLKLPSKKYGADVLCITNAQFPDSSTAEETMLREE